MPNEVSEHTNWSHSCLCLNHTKLSYNNQYCLHCVCYSILFIWVIKYIYINRPVLWSMLMAYKMPWWVTKCCFYSFSCPHWPQRNPFFFFYAIHNISDWRLNLSMWQKPTWGFSRLPNQVGIYMASLNRRTDFSHQLNVQLHNMDRWVLL